MPVNGNPAGHPLAVFPHEYIAPICASFMDPQKLQLDWWYWLWKPTKQTVEVLFKWNEKNFLFKTQISLIFSCVHFSQGKIPTQKKKTRQNSPPKNGRVLGEFLASRRVFFTRPHSMPTRCGSHQNDNLKDMSKDNPRCETTPRLSVTT